MKGRRERSANFTQEEKIKLMKCILPEKDIVFNRKIDTDTIKLKEEAWDRICNAYNSIASDKRTKQSLRSKFTNMRKLVRQAKRGEHTFTDGSVNMKEDFRKSASPELKDGNDDDGFDKDNEFHFEVPKREKDVSSSPQSEKETDAMFNVNFVDNNCVLIDNNVAEKSEQELKTRLLQLQVLKLIKENRLLDIEIALKEKQLDRS